MSGPWLKFYPSDWRADPALRMCSIAARGLWMELLCVMHEAEPYGSLRINGKPVSDRQVASLAGASVDDVSELLHELEEAGVFSRDNDSVIISRRMQRDKVKAEADRANGKRGGNPGLTEGVNPTVKGEDKAQKPEARTQKEEADASSKTRAIDEFSEWYQHYPHKVQRGAAERAFVTARKLASLEALIAGTQRYVASKPADYAWRNPATWLNGKGWLDAPAPAPRPHSTASPKKLTQGESLRNMARAAGVIDDTGNPPRRLETGQRDGENPGAGDVVRLAITGNHGW